MALSVLSKIGGVGLGTNEAVPILGDSLAFFFIFKVKMNLIVDYQAEYHIAGLLLDEIAVLHIKCHTARHIVVGIGFGP